MLSDCNTAGCCCQRRAHWSVPAGCVINARWCAGKVS